MLALDCRFEGFTTSDWLRVLALFTPRRPTGDRDPDRPRGGVIALHGGGRLQKLVHTHVGRLRLDDAQRDWPLPAGELARRHHASFALSLEVGVLEDLMERLGARVRRGDDLTAQTLLLLELMREELLDGRIEAWPHRLQGVPIPSPAVVRGTLDTVCPRGKAMVLGLFDQGELWTSLALRRGPDGIDRILGPDELRADMGLLAGDWRRDYRHLSRAIEDRLGPVAFGCFAEAGTFTKLEVDPNPGAWARAIAVRDVILSPVPLAVAVPVGIDVGRAAFGLVQRLAERVDPVGIVGPTLAAVSRLRVGDREIADVLGFEPLDVLRKLLSRER